jgi:hypothetical protein
MDHMSANQFLDFLNWSLIIALRKLKTVVKYYWILFYDAGGTSTATPSLTGSVSNVSFIHWAAPLN